MIRKLTSYLHHLFIKRDISLFKEIDRHSSLSRTEVEKHQLKRLIQIVDHAKETVPHYKDKFIGHQLNSLSDIVNLPILKKDDIRAAQERLISSKVVAGRYINTSGGSTGKPIKVYQDSKYALEGSATFLFVKKMRMQNPFGLVILLWGAVRDLYGSKNSIKGHIKDFVTNTKIFNSARLTESDIVEFVDYLNSSQPDMVLAYAQSIYEVAVYVSTQSIKVDKQKAIHTGAGQLYPFMREKIEEVFQCKVYNHYGGREFGAVASECVEGGGLHILAYNRIVEIVDEDGNQCPVGVEGDVVVTVLDNYTMPLIRYKVGDRAIMAEYSPCGCGIAYPKIQKISGRTSNNFKRKAGGFVSGEYLTLTFNHIPGIISFQIRQITLDEIDIYLIIDDKYQIVTESKIIKKFKNLFSPNLAVEFKYVRSIPRTKTGKHLFTVSELIK